MGVALGALVGRVVADGGACAPDLAAVGGVEEAPAVGWAAGDEHAASARQAAPAATSRVTLLMRRRYAAWLCSRPERTSAFLRTRYDLRR
ncbi:MAG TPA: hypothetical protein VFL38_13600 [Humibacillus xanthopallidus]|nr:hypothetical protein [Humibacillus xanthopallidus]